jgi:hypothetical protein
VLPLKKSNIYELELASPVNCISINNNDHYSANGTYKTSQQLNSSWKKLDAKKFGIELPKDTIVLAEKCIEYQGHVI